MLPTTSEEDTYFQDQLSIEKCTRTKCVTLNSCEHVLMQGSKHQIVNGLTKMVWVLDILNPKIVNLNWNLCLEVSFFNFHVYWKKRISLLQ
jgi:hypothetical protein